MVIVGSLSAMPGGGNGEDDPEDLLVALEEAQALCETR